MGIESRVFFFCICICILIIRKWAQSERRKVAIYAKSSERLFWLMVAREGVSMGRTGDRKSWKKGGFIWCDPSSTDQHTAGYNYYYYYHYYCRCYFTTSFCFSFVLFNNFNILLLYSCLLFSVTLSLHFTSIIFYSIIFQSIIYTCSICFVGLQ